MKKQKTVWIVHTSGNDWADLKIFDSKKTMRSWMEQERIEQDKDGTYFRTCINLPRFRDYYHVVELPLIIKEDIEVPSEAIRQTG